MSAVAERLARWREWCNRNPDDDREFHLLLSDAEALLAERDAALADLARVQKEAEEARERFEVSRANEAQSQKDWIALCRLACAEEEAEWIEDADDSEVLEAADPWHAIRSMRTRIASLSSDLARKTRALEEMRTMHEEGMDIASCEGDEAALDYHTSCLARINLALAAAALGKEETNETL